MPLPRSSRYTFLGLAHASHGVFVGRAYICYRIGLVRIIELDHIILTTSGVRRGDDLVPFQNAFTEGDVLAGQTLACILEVHECGSIRIGVDYLGGILATNFRPERIDLEDDRRVL